MTTYVVLLTGDEAAWDRMSPEEQEAEFAKHEEFSRLLAERGHRLLDGQELTPSSTSKTITRDPDGRVVVTDGPYAESAEQVGAFYVVESGDLDGLLEVCAVLAGPGGAIEVRAAVDHATEG